MHWPLALLLVASPDGGVAEQRPKQDYSGLIEYGASRAAESWGPQKPRAPAPEAVLDVSSDKLRVRGPRPMDAIREGVARQVDGIARCAKSNLDRSFIVGFEVDADGFVTTNVAAPQVGATPPDADFERCVAGAIPAWLFPKTEKRARSQIYFPLTLRPR